MSEFFYVFLPIFDIKLVILSAINEKYYKNKNK
jgi:hypothetical protein